MLKLAAMLWKDDAGFIISAELILVSTIVVLGMVVGLSEVSNAVNQELEDVASAFGSVNQSYRYSGVFSSGKGALGGSSFNDHADACDGQWDIVCGGSSGESHSHHN